MSSFIEVRKVSLEKENLDVVVQESGSSGILSNVEEKVSHNKENIPNTKMASTSLPDESQSLYEEKVNNICHKATSTGIKSRSVSPSRLSNHSVASTLTHGKARCASPSSLARSERTAGVVKDSKASTRRMSFGKSYLADTYSSKLSAAEAEALIGEKQVADSPQVAAFKPASGAASIPAKPRALSPLSRQPR